MLDSYLFKKKRDRVSGNISPDLMIFISLYNERRCSSRFDKHAHMTENQFVIYVVYTPK